MISSSRNQIFDGQSPREHRAHARLKDLASATDSSADESPEVEQTGDTHPADTLRLRRDDARQEEPATNDERAATAVARAIRPVHAPDTTPLPGSLGNGRGSGARLKSVVDAEQLLTRGKLRRVKRHWERSKGNEYEPRRDGDGTNDPSGSHEPEPRSIFDKRTLEERPLGVRTENSPSRVHFVPLRRTRRSGLMPRLERPATWRTP